MKGYSRLRASAATLYAAAVILFVLFFCYLGWFEGVEVTSIRHGHSYAPVTPAAVEAIADEAAPAGSRRVYRWTLEEDQTDGECLCFYISHACAEVWIGGEQVYSLEVGADNRIGGTVSSNWVSVPITSADGGKEIAVVLTPLFESAAGVEPEFLIGSHQAIFFDQLTQDLHQIFLGLLCILIGILMVIVQLYFCLRVRSSQWDMVLLGNFAVYLGVWRLTDVMSAPILFSEHTMVLGYIAIGVLFLSSPVLILIVSTPLKERRGRPMLLVSMAASCASLLALVLQLLCGVDLKESLILCHGMLLAAILAIGFLALSGRKHRTELQSSAVWQWLPLLAVGIGMDIAGFYIHNSSANILYTLIAFVVYALIVFVSSLLTITRRAYTDPRTGLANKSRWIEMLREDADIRAPLCIMLMDLNGLKRVNDTMGHESGDRLISSFAGILRNTLPSSSMICRWGGDEFSVMLTGIDREEMDWYIRELQKAVTEYNQENEALPISYAIGAALSTEHPGLSRTALFQLADERMYRDKQNWYQQKRSP